MLKKMITGMIKTNLLVLYYICQYRNKNSVLDGSNLWPKWTKLGLLFRASYKRQNKFTIA